MRQPRLPWLTIFLLPLACASSAQQGPEPAHAEASATAAPESRAPAATEEEGEGLDVAQIRPVVQGSYPAVRGCHTIEHSGRGRREGGHVTVDMQIRADGTVNAAEVTESTFESEQLHECVLSVSRGLKFPEAAGSTEMSWKFRFAGKGGSMAQR